MNKRFGKVPEDETRFRSDEMRIWSLHPKYLDAKGLVALWRETLLAKNVLKGNTKGYQNHPQLIRFRESRTPLDCVDSYLAGVYEEATSRGYQFDKSKIGCHCIPSRLTVTSGQLAYEFAHLRAKLKKRDPKRLTQLADVKVIAAHPLFEIIEGYIEYWERPVSAKN